MVRVVRVSGLGLGLGLGLGSYLHPHPPSTPSGSYMGELPTKEKLTTLAPPPIQEDPYHTDPLAKTRWVGQQIAEDRRRNQVEPSTEPYGTSGEPDFELQPRS